MKLRERFEEIMGFQKSDLNSSMNTEEKVLSEMMEKESDESKTSNTNCIEPVLVIGENSDVSTNLKLF